MVIDCFTFNGEYDLLEIRLNILDEYVDQFIIVEAHKTFSGLPKPLYYWIERNRYKKWWHKIYYFKVDEDDNRLWEMAEQSPNTQGAFHWKREFVQKESIKKALKHLQDDDLVFIGDVDEIWHPSLTKIKQVYPFKCNLRVYTYYLNNRSSERFWGTLYTDYATVKEHCINHLRTNAPKSGQNDGWHFTSMGGYEEVKRKLENSYTKETYADKRVMDALQDNVENSKDFLGRGFTYTLDESDWPPWLKENREQYLHLIK